MKIFLDCGYYAGKVLDMYLADGRIDKDWVVYAFEPNRDLTLDVSRFPFKVKLIKKAVWVKDGRVKFHIAGREDSASIKDTTGHTEPKEITVQSIDFSKFVAELPQAHIVCSMDIEGAEFYVLKKMIADGTVGRIAFLDIEFHHRFMNDYTDKEAQELIDGVEAAGVKVKLKVDLR